VRLSRFSGTMLSQLPFKQRLEWCYLTEDIEIRAYISCARALLCQAFGKTPLNEVSPKKTIEGAIVGLSSSVAVAVTLAHFLQWPTSLFRYLAVLYLHDH
jgi:dolichol kinase